MDMNKQKWVYIILIIQGVISLSFLLGLFFVLPHKFSEAIFHYVRLAPVIRNYYCLSLLITGLIGIYSVKSLLMTKVKHRFAMVKLILIGATMLFGLLIYPLVESFYQTQSGIIQESIHLYRVALMNLSIYLSLHATLGICSVYYLACKMQTKKQILGLCLLLGLSIVPSCIFSYQKYYDYEEINLTENLKFEFVGVNGQGSLKVISNNHRINDIFPTFMSSLTYEVLENGALSNGQQVAVKVIYDHEVAKELHLDIVDEVETIEVSGLREFYARYEDIPVKIVEEVKNTADQYVQAKLLEVLPGKETQVSLVTQYYIMDEGNMMDSEHALVNLYRIGYVHQSTNYYYYRACHVNNVHSDALKDLEILEPVIAASTYRSSLCEQGVSDISSAEAAAHLYAALLNQYDYVEEVNELSKN